MTDLRHPALEPRYSDVLYRMATSGFYIGPNKQRGSEALCKRCAGKGDASAADTPETLEHAYAECGEVAHLWRLVTTAWNTNMEQQLDLRLRLLASAERDTRAALDAARLKG